MKRILLISSYLCIYLNGCNLYTSKDGDDIKNPSSNDASTDFSLDTDATNRFKPDMVRVNLGLKRNGSPSVGTLTVNLSCDNVYSPNSPGDWQMHNVTVTENNGEYTVDVVNQTSCSVTILSYYDGVDTYTPVNSNAPLIINIAADGTVTSSTTPVEYTNGATPTPVLQWFVASPNPNDDPFVAIIYFAGNYVHDPDVNTPTPVQGQPVTLSVEQIPAPELTSLELYSSNLNSETTWYTLVADVTGATNCVYISYPPFPGFDATSWTDVNQAYNDAVNTCPDLTGDHGSSGNWNDMWPNDYLLIWANEVNNLNSYTTAVVGQTTH